MLYSRRKKRKLNKSVAENVADFFITNDEKTIEKPVETTKKKKSKLKE